MVATLRYPSDIARLYHERGGLPYMERIDVPDYATAKKLAYEEAERRNLPIELVCNGQTFVAYPSGLVRRGYR